MSRWARENPDRMAAIARLPIGEQGSALRADALALAPTFPCRSCAATRVRRPDDFCSNCISEAMAEAHEPSAEQLDAEYEAQRYDDMREQYR